MVDGSIAIAVQVHLSEYSALRQEILEMIKWRERLVFLSLGISGALFSFAFSADRAVPGPLMSRRMALYVVPPLAGAIGGLWMVNARRIYRISVYIRDVLAPKLNDLLSQPTATRRATTFEFLTWESSRERVMHKWSRRLLEWVVLLAAFVLTGAVAQYLLIMDQTGRFIDRVRKIEGPLWFSVNCAVVLVSFLLFVGHLWVGKRNVGAPGIRNSSAVKHNLIHLHPAFA
ncbi:MAG: hypothetical protein DMG96_33005 [Acidobacteria bacterium]|nr:MAG: hypothetical protein DMG96_33005 [Acidobacteriota bacterium]